MPEDTQLVERSHRMQFDLEELTLIKSTICVGATDAELRLFVAQCKRTGLDPFAKQIYAVKRWNTQQNKETMSIQIAIDGYRLIAERTGKYAGQLGPFWCGKDGVWKEVWIDDTLPLAAKVGVLRSDFKEPVWVTAKYSSFVQTKKDGTVNHFWKMMPEVMLAKVAESQALRKAFPQDLSGTCTPEEDGAEANVSMLPSLFDQAKEAIADCKSISDLASFKIEYDRQKSQFTADEQAQVSHLAKERKTAIEGGTTPATTISVVTPAQIEAPKPTAIPEIIVVPHGGRPIDIAQQIIDADLKKTLEDAMAAAPVEDPAIREFKLNQAILATETLDAYTPVRDQLVKELATFPDDAQHRLKKTAKAQREKLEKKLAS